MKELTDIEDRLDSISEDLQKLSMRNQDQEERIRSLEGLINAYEELRERVDRLYRISANLTTVSLKLNEDPS